MLTDEKGFITAEADLVAGRALLRHREFEADERASPLIDFLDRREKEIAFSPVPIGSDVVATVKARLLVHWLCTDVTIYADEIEYVLKELIEFTASFNAWNKAQLEILCRAEKHMTAFT